MNRNSTESSSIAKGIAFPIAIFVFALLLISASLTLMDRPGWIVYDWLQRLTALPETPDVAMILVDQNTVDQLANVEKITFPFPRQLFGIVNAVAGQVGSRAVLYDILFTEPSSYGVDDDEAFAKQIKDANVPSFFPAASEKGFVKDPVPQIRTVASGLGGVHFSVDADGVIRRAPQTLEGASGQVLSLPEMAFQKLQKGSVDPNEISAREKLLRFYQAKGIPFVSFYDLILAYRQLQSGQAIPDNVSNLKNRVLIVGYSAPGLHDLKPISTDNEAPGVLVPATALANRFSGEGILVTSTRTYLLCSAALLIAILFIGFLIETPKLSALFVIGIFPVGVAGLSYLFWLSRFWFNPFPLEIGVIVAGGSQLLAKFYAYWVERRKFAKSLEYSMSPEMLRMIQSGQLEVERYGEQREITIFFSDVVGFTKLSESLDPKQLISILNQYSDSAVDLIFKNGGYVDKFIGDAVMAFWGAPVPQDNHAARAVNVAVQFASTVQAFNLRVKTQYPNFQGLQVRIGVHTGNAIVGNIGAKNRHNYTAIGDSVNLASRLEGLAKVYDCHVILSEETIARANAKSLPGWMELDHVIVKGRSLPTRIYTYVDVAWASEIPSYESGLAKYYEGNWEAALKEFEKVNHIPSAYVMAERCRKGISQKEMNEWNQGVWSYEGK